MLRRVRAGAALLRRRWKVSLAVALLAAATGVCAGPPLWARYHYRAAEQALNADRYEDARRHVLRCAAVCSGRPAVCLLAARIERRRGDYPEAQAWLQRCRELPGGVTEAMQLEWTLLRAERGEVDEVAPGLWACVKAGHPESPRILEALAATYMRQARYLSARNCLNRWLEREPNAVRALDWRSWVHDRLDVRNQAMEDCLRALELEPGRTAVRLRLIDMLLDGNRPLEALPHVEHLRQRLPHDPQVVVALARCRRTTGQGEEAHRLVDEVLAAAPDHSGALLERARLDLESNRPTQAETDLRRLLKVRRHDVEAMYLLAQALRHQGRKKEANVVLGRWKQGKADWERLFNLLRRAAEESSDPERLSEIGRIFLRLGEERLSRLWLARARAAAQLRQARTESASSAGSGSTADRKR
jgi:predicted Zn-dependent protease